MAKEIVSVKVEGLAELDQALLDLAEEFSTRNAKTVLRKALRDAGQIIADAGQQNAPRASPVVSKRPLAETYTVSTKLSKRQKSLHRKESALEVFVGPTPHPKSVQTEFGNSHQAAHPHLRPAWDANMHRSLEVMVDQTRVRLEATRARLVKRQQKLLSQIK